MRPGRVTLLLFPLCFSSMGTAAQLGRAKQKPERRSGFFVSANGESISYSERDRNAVPVLSPRPALLLAGSLVPGPGKLALCRKVLNGGRLRRLRNSCGLCD